MSIDSFLASLPATLGTMTPKSGSALETGDFEIDLIVKGELVLSDGRFAKYHHVKWGHRMGLPQGDPIAVACCIILRTVYLDDRPITWEEVLNLNPGDAHLLLNKLF